MHLYSYLALGDSYTIGESIPLSESFPYQTVHLLRKDGYNVNAPEVIANTGWTTDELQAALDQTSLLPKYDFVTLLIGVNNQYRGRDAIQYKEQLEELLKRSIALANGKKEHVIILSIPDYSVMPFSRNLDREKISKEIEVFNGINKALSIQYKVQYLDIASAPGQTTEEAGTAAADGLHPSGTIYLKWAKKLAELIEAQLK